MKNQTSIKAYVPLRDAPKEKISVCFRRADIDDLEQITNLEGICFPKAEAATKQSFEQRLKWYPNHFLVGEVNGTIISCINGFVTNEKDLQDAMYQNAEEHTETGKWQMIFGVETHPAYQRLGIAALAMQHFIAIAKEEKRWGLVLTCKKELVPFYKKFGFVEEGISESSHGGASWFQMRLTFESEQTREARFV